MNNQTVHAVEHPRPSPLPLKELGKIGNIIVRLDLSNERPDLIFNDTTLAECLGALLSPEPFVVDWDDAATDHVALRLAYTAAVDRRIAEIISVLTTVYFVVPDSIRMEHKQ